MIKIIQRLRRVRRDDSGATALEFAIIAPLFFALMFSFYDVGILMLRDAMLSHAVDKSIREVRLGDDLSPAEFTERVCDRAFLLAKCKETLIVDTREVGGASIALPTGATPCLSPTNPSLKPATTFQPNVPSRIMYMRVCAVSAPMVTANFLGYNFARHLAGGHQDGMARIVATTAYMGE